MQFSSERLKSARERAHLKQKELADKAGVSLRSLAGWETGAVPSHQNAVKLCNALQIDLQELYTQETIGDVKITRSNLVKNVDKGFVLKDQASVKLIPVVSWAAAGAAHDYEDLANQMDEFIESPTRDPNAFALIVEGDSMENELHAGDMVVVSPGAEPRNKDAVVARLAESRGVLLKWFQRSGPEGKIIKLISANPAYPPREYRQEEFAFIYPVIEVRRQRPKML